MQEIIVYIIGGALACYIAWRTWRVLSGRHPEDMNPCSGCKGCAAKDEFLRQREKCAGESGGGGCPHCGPRK